VLAARPRRIWEIISWQCKDAAELRRIARAKISDFNAAGGSRRGELSPYAAHNSFLRWIPALLSLG
jgi:hypothetical protein